MLNRGLHCADYVSDQESCAEIDERIRDAETAVKNFGYIETQPSTSAGIFSIGD